MWSCVSLPMRVLAPLFFSDPAGAVVGKATSSPQWWGKKTIAGSMAVFVTALLSVEVVCIQHRVILAVVVTLAEALGGRCDNITIAMVVLGYYYWFINVKQ
eukprot:GHVR01121382.1.p1 GENE.GHVR01121382.1~~GHVR01121382.1.p1  ORF type:complete len:101 (-),score=23.28 GHVR01121382.1:312-614(-)